MNKYERSKLRLMVMHIDQLEKHSKFSLKINLRILIVMLILLMCFYESRSSWTTLSSDPSVIERNEYAN